MSGSWMANGRVALDEVEHGLRVWIDARNRKLRDDAHLLRGAPVNTWPAPFERMPPFDADAGWRPRTVDPASAHHAGS